MNRIDKRVLIICGLSLIWILVYKIMFVDLSAIFYKATEVGEITFTLLSSVIASSIFYYFVVYLDNRKVAKILYPSINERLKTFGVGLFIIKNDLYRNIKGQSVPDKLPNLDDFREICDGIILTSKPPIIMGNPSYQFDTWFEYFNYFFNSDNFISKQLYSHISYLTPEILKELDEIQYSVFQRSLDVYKQNRRYDKLSGNSGPFWSYLKTLEKLSEIKLK